MAGGDNVVKNFEEKFKELRVEGHRKEPNSSTSVMFAEEDEYMDDNEEKEKKSPFLVEILKGAFLERRPLMMCRPNSVLQTAPLSPKLNSSQQAKIKYHANI